jgi:hypothetical protein
MKLKGQLGTYTAIRIQNHKMPNLSKWSQFTKAIDGIATIVWAQSKGSYFKQNGTNWYVADHGFWMDYDFKTDNQIYIPTTERKYRPQVQCFSKMEKSFRGIHTDEKNDCTVFATAVVCGVSYEEAHTYLKERGRQPKRGLVFNKFLRDHDGIMGHPVTEVYREFKGKTVHSFLNENPQGKFLVFVNRHVSAVIDGKLYDGWWSNRQYITQIFKVW